MRVALRPTVATMAAALGAYGSVLWLALGTGLREISYACRAAATAALAFLYGYFGQAAPSLLVHRLGGIVLGGLVGVAVSWFVLPVRGRGDDVLTGLRAWPARVCATVYRPIRRGPRRP